MEVGVKLKGMITTCITSAEKEFLRCDCIVAYKFNVFRGLSKGGNKLKITDSFTFLILMFNEHLSWNLKWLY